MALLIPTKQVVRRKSRSATWADMHGEEKTMLFPSKVVLPIQLFSLTRTALGQKGGKGVASPPACQWWTSTFLRFVTNHPSWIMLLPGLAKPFIRRVCFSHCFTVIIFTRNLSSNPSKKNIMQTGSRNYQNFSTIRSALINKSLCLLRSTFSTNCLPRLKWILLTDILTQLFIRYTDANPSSKFKRLKLKA